MWGECVGGGGGPPAARCQSVPLMRFDPCAAFPATAWAGMLVGSARRPCFGFGGGGVLKGGWELVRSISVRGSPCCLFGMLQAAAAAARYRLGPALALEVIPARPFATVKKARKDKDGDAGAAGKADVKDGGVPWWKETAPTFCAHLSAVVCTDLR